MIKTVESIPHIEAATIISDSPDHLTLQPDELPELFRMSVWHRHIFWTHKGMTWELNKTMIENAVEADALMRKWPAFKAQRKPVVFPASSCTEVKSTHL